jgi:hypothetical protein
MLSTVPLFFGGTVFCEKSVEHFLGLSPIFENF